MLPKDDDTTCDCILAGAHPQFEGHTVGEHRREPCPGTWGFDPPCGGCINCLCAQAYYYQHLEQEARNAA